jgi:hypothetical protein
VAKCDLSQCAATYILHLLMMEFIYDEALQHGEHVHLWHGGIVPANVDNIFMPKWVHASV